jgi:hypothetical protein
VKAVDATQFDVAKSSFLNNDVVKGAGDLKTSLPSGFLTNDMVDRSIDNLSGDNKHRTQA